MRSTSDVRTWNTCSNPNAVCAFYWFSYKSDWYLAPSFSTVQWPVVLEVSISSRTGQLPFFMDLLLKMCVYSYVFTHPLSLSHAHTYIYICSRMLFFFLFEERIFLFQCMHLNLFMLFFKTYIFPLPIERLSQIPPCYIIFPSTDKIALLLIYLATVSLYNRESVKER